MGNLRAIDETEVEVVARRLWAGGVATAVVAAGVAVLGVLILNTVLEVGIQAVGTSGALVDNAGTIIPVAAALVALAGTALLHVLLLTTPRPASFFSAIAFLVLAVLILQVFLADGTLGVHLATAVLYAVIGGAVVSLLSGVSATSVRPKARPSTWRPDAPPPGYDAGYGRPGPYDTGAGPPPSGPAGPTQRYDPRGRGWG